MIYIAILEESGGKSAQDLEQQRLKIEQNEAKFAELGKRHEEGLERLSQQDIENRTKALRDQDTVQPTDEDLDNYRNNELNGVQGHTIAVGKTDVPGLEGKTFKGASPTIRKAAGLKDLDEIAPNRGIKSPSKYPPAQKHAEEGVIYEFEEAVKEAGLRPEEITGTLYIHQSNPRGVCTTCIQGLAPDSTAKQPGIVKQLSQKYPKLTIVATSQGSEGVSPCGRQSFTAKNGSYV